MSQLPSFDERIQSLNPQVAEMLRAAGYTPRHTGGHGTMAWIKEIAPAESLMIDREFDIDGDAEARYWRAGRWFGESGVGGEDGYIGVGETLTLAEAIEVAAKLPRPVLPNGTHADIFGESLEEAVRALNAAGQRRGRSL